MKYLVMIITSLIACSAVAQNTNYVYRWSTQTNGAWEANSDSTWFDGQVSADLSMTSATYLGEGLGYDFNGSTSQGDAGTNKISATTLTISAWFYLDVTSSAKGSSQSIVAHETSGVNAGDFQIYVASNDDKIHFSCGYGGSQIEILSNSTIATGAWYHITAQWDQSAGGQKLWVDGTLQSQTATPTGPAGDADNKLGIGYNSLFSFHLNGRIDDVIIYYETLTDSERAYNYANRNWALSDVSIYQTIIRGL